MSSCIAFQSSDDVGPFLSLASDLGLETRQSGGGSEDTVAEALVPGDRLVEFLDAAAERGVDIDGFEVSTSEQVAIVKERFIPVLKTIVRDDVGCWLRQVETNENTDSAEW